jgi:hypothetical protein
MAAQKKPRKGSYAHAIQQILKPELHREPVACMKCKATGEQTILTLDWGPVNWVRMPPGWWTCGPDGPHRCPDCLSFDGEVVK